MTFFSFLAKRSNIEPRFCPIRIIKKTYKARTETPNYVKAAERPWS